MKKAIVFLAAVLLAAGAARAEEPYNYVQVNGHAEREIVPDEIYLSITLTEADSKGKISLETQKQNLRTALRKIGVDIEKNLKTTDLSSTYVRRRNAVAQQTYQLRLSSAAEVAKAYAALDAAGIYNVAVSKVSNSQLQQYRDEIRQEAIRNARRTAQSLAEAVGQKIGACFYIFDSNYDSMPVFYKANTFMTRAAAADAVEEESLDEEVEFKSIKLRYDVQAKFLLEL